MKLSKVWGSLSTGACALLVGVSALALQAVELPKIAPQSQLTLPVPVNGSYENRTVKVDTVGMFKDLDGSEWMRVDTQEDDNLESQTLFVDASGGEVEIGLNVADLDLADLGITLDQLRAMAKAGQGDVNYEDKKYVFSGSGRSKFIASTNASPVNVGYFILQEEQDPNVSIMVLNWGDTTEVLLNEKVDASQVKLQ